MRKYLPLAALLVALPAAAEFAVIEDADEMTVYREGNQIIVLVDTKSKNKMREVAKTRSPERAVNANFRSQLSGKDMFYFYLVRTRMLEGVPVCEKFFERYPEEERRQQMIKILSLAPCG